jgi:hypothetical protein
MSYFTENTVCPNYKHYSWEDGMNVLSLNAICQLFLSNLNQNQNVWTNSSNSPKYKI